MVLNNQPPGVPPRPKTELQELEARGGSVSSSGSGRFLARLGKAQALGATAELAAKKVLGHLDNDE